MDLSAGGAAFRARVDVARGAPVFVDFAYQKTWICQATGHVVRVLPFGAPSGVEIEFGFANDELQTFLRTFDQISEALRPNLLRALSDMRVRIA